MKITKSRKSANLRYLSSQACTRQHTHPKNAWVAPLERRQNTSQYIPKGHRHIMHGLNIAKMTKVHDELTVLQFNSRSLLLTAFLVSRWPQMQMMQCNEMMYMSRRRFWYIIRLKRIYGCGDTSSQTSHKKLGFLDKSQRGKFGSEIYCSSGGGAL